MVGGSTISNTIENVLILQGGGSLGAFGCGVFKALASNNIKIDIVAGTSIGGVNAAIIAGGKQEDHPEKVLEQYWLELAEGSTSSNSCGNGNLNLPQYTPSVEDTKLTRISQTKSTMSFYGSALHGNKKVFIPRWKPEYCFTDPQYFAPNNWTYLYDHSPLVKTAEKYIDYNKLQPKVILMPV
jgi:NTE family protein